MIDSTTYNIQTDGIIAETLDAMLGNAMLRERVLELGINGRITTLLELYNIPLHMFIRKENIAKIATLIETNKDAQTFILNLVEETHSRFRMIGLSVENIARDALGTSVTTRDNSPLTGTFNKLLRKDPDEVAEVLSCNIISALYLFRLYMSSLHNTQTSLSK